MTQSLTDDLNGTPLGAIARKAWQFALGLGVFALLFGAVLLFWPVPTLVVLGALFGVYLLLSGIVEIVLAFAPYVPGWTRVVSVVTGILSIGLGVLCFRDQLESVLLLGVWIGVGWIMTGVGRVVASSSANYPGRGWSIFAGVLLFIGGVVLVVWPADSIPALALVTSVWLIVIGAAQIIDAIQLRKSVEPKQ